jgi:hypothetical protein
MSYFPEDIPLMSKEELRKNGIRIPKDATDKNVGTTDARQDFMDIVYAELASDPDNNRANRIIWAADGYAKSAPLGTNLAEVGTDCISRQAIDKFIDGLEEIFADLRERHVDDSVCGLCEYDGAYIGQSGDWCNECPGFDKDDCFKLSDKTRKEWTEKIIKALPPSQPEPCEDAVSRTEVLRMINCINDHHAITPYKSVGAVTEHLTRIASNLPPVTPKQRWIPVTERLPEEDGRYLVCGAKGGIYHANYRGRWWTQVGCGGKIVPSVVAWMPLPEPWEGDANAKI